MSAGNGLPDDDDDPDALGGWCVTCLDPFHYDDCGGYNPPCACGLHCRSCHERADDLEMDYWDDDDDDEVQE